MFPPLLHSLTEVYSCTRWLFGRKCSLNDCILLYFSEIKWFRKYFKAITYMKHAVVLNTIWNTWMRGRTDGRTHGYTCTDIRSHKPQLTDNGCKLTMRKPCFIYLQLRSNPK
jgi:hypothetical protein